MVGGVLFIFLKNDGGIFLYKDHKNDIKGVETLQIFIRR